MGLFDLQGKYFKTAYAFKAMGQMLDTPKRLAVEGTDTFGFATIAGESADGKTVQIFISNYAIPAGYKPGTMEMPSELKDADTPDWDAAKYKMLPVRNDIVYKDNAGYDLAIQHLPWGKKNFSVKRYRLNDTLDLELVEDGSGSGDTFRVRNPLSPDGVELIVLRSN
jgi:hypothetical protein